MRALRKGALAGATLALCLLGRPLLAQETATAAEEMSELDRIVDSGTLRVGVNPNFMPFSFLDEAGTRVGVDIDIAGQLAGALGVELEVTAPEEFVELVPMLVDGKIDLILAGMSITLERAMKVSFTDPYFDTGMSLMMNIGTAAKLGIAGAKDSGALLDTLKASGKESGLTIAVTEGKAPALEAARRFPEASIVGYPTNEEAARATADGKADVMLHDEIFLKVWLQQNGDSVPGRLIVLDPPIKPDFYGIAARQGDPDWLGLLDVFVRGLRADRTVSDHLVGYLPSMAVAETRESAIPLFELRDME